MSRPVYRVTIRKTIDRYLRFTADSPADALARATSIAAAPHTFQGRYEVLGVNETSTPILDSIVPEEC